MVFGLSLADESMMFLVLLVTALAANFYTSYVTQYCPLQGILCNCIFRFDLLNNLASFKNLQQHQTGMLPVNELSLSNQYVHLFSLTFFQKNCKE